jgi:FkbM family methyltransferase
MLTKNNVVRRKALSALRHFLCYLENNGNSNFKINGEQRFIEALFAWLQRAREESFTLFDVGANTGSYSQMLLDKLRLNGLSAKLHLFEPTAACVRQLHDHFGSDETVVITQAAVSDQSGLAKVFYDTPKSGFASLYRRNMSAYAVALDMVEDVQRIRLDAYIQHNGLKHIHFMKVDVEGHEQAVLSGLGGYLNPVFIDFIQFEYGGANLDSRTSLRDLYSAFEDRGFIVTKVMKTGLEIRPYTPWMENFQYANFVAISNDIIKAMK